MSLDKLITSKQASKLMQMLADQNVSIENIEVIDPEVVLPPSPLTNLELFNPFMNHFGLGTVRQTNNVQEWIDFYLDQPRMRNNN